AAKTALFGEEVLGKKIDLDFIQHLGELRKTKDITPCGEAGEYHTFVIDGPLFKQRVEISETRKTTHEGTCFLEILSASVMDKP
ncbi:ATP-binding protein, partial [Chloroflexota bacterium]